MYYAPDITTFCHLSLVARVHALLYFLCPVGHGLKPLDLELMQRLGDSVNIIPVISKADTFTRTEMETFKLNVGSHNNPLYTTY